MHTPEERLNGFRRELAVIVSTYNVELSCEPMTAISVVCADKPMAGHFEFPSNANPYEIAKSEVIIRLTPQ
jgi:hypothetical protein